MAVTNEVYDVFISYSRLDKRHAAEIESILRARGLKSFFDRRNLPAGLPWVRELERAIGNAKSVIVLIGPHGFGNTQQYERDLAFLRQTRDPSFPVIPVILPETTTDRPFDFLQVLTWIDFSHVAKVSDAPDVLEHLLAAIYRREGPPDTAREAICPYRGLDAFREEDATFFFGRGSASDPASPIGQLVHKVREHSFVVVVGRSGSGKSSLIFAGLLPALRRERDRFWSVVSLRPGSAPLRTLAAAFNPRPDDEGAVGYAAKISDEADKLRTGDRELLSHMIRHELDQTEGKPDRLLLYIDQWEELYAQAPPTSGLERASQHAADVDRFVDLLLVATQSAPVSVVATVRADFYDSLIAHQEIRELLPHGQVLLASMSRSELERTIVEPANKIKLTFDPPGLVQRILDDAGEDESMLPLLQYALKETWAFGNGNAMTAASYARSGGVRGAIRITAERTFDALSSGDQQGARKLFLRLVTPGEGQEDTRTRAAMPKEEMLRKVVEQFAGPRTRLLVTGWDRAGRPTVEMAHEALIRTWPRLRAWIDASREKLRARAAVLRDKAEWEQQGRREDLLLPPGFQLERARALLADPGDLATDDIQEFIALSSDREHAISRAERERQMEAERAVAWEKGARQYAELEHERLRLQTAQEESRAAHRLANRSRAVAALLGVAVILALIALGIFAYDRDKLEAARDISEKRAEDAVAAGKAALEAMARAANAQKRAELEAKLAARQSKYKNEYLTFLSTSETIAGRPTTGMALALQTLAHKGEQSDVSINNRAVGTIALALQHNPLRLLIRGNNARFQDDGTRILTVSQNGPARVYDVVTGVTLVSEAWEFENGVSANFDVSADGHTVAMIGETTGKEGIVLGGRNLSTAVIWHPDTPTWLKTAESGEFRSSALKHISLSPDGRFLLTTSNMGVTCLHEVATGKRLAQTGYEGVVPEEIGESELGRTNLSVKRDPLESAFFAPDGKQALALYEDTTARILSLENAKLTEVARLIGHVVEPTDGWRRVGARAPPSPEGGISTAVYAPTGELIATAGAFDTTARLWDGRSGKMLRVFEGHEGKVLYLVFSANGQFLLTASADGTARVWETATGRLILVLRGHTGGIRSAAFDATAERIATGGTFDGVARVWNARTGEELAAFKEHKGTIQHVEFAPDGRTLLTSATDDWTRVWNIGNENPIASINDSTKKVTKAEIDSTGTRLLTVSSQGQVHLWDAETGDHRENLVGNSAIAALFSPDGSETITWSVEPANVLSTPKTEQGKLDLWDAHSGAHKEAYSTPTGTLVAQRWTEDSPRLLVRQYDTFQYIAGSAVVRPYKISDSTIAVLGPHGLVAIAMRAQPFTTKDADVSVWDTSDGSSRTLRGHTGDILAIAFDARGEKIATGGSDGTARIWHASSGEELHRLEAGFKDVGKVLFSPDGSRVLIADGEKKGFPEPPSGNIAQIFSVETGLEQQTLRGHRGRLLDAAFSPRGNLVVTSSNDTTIRLWHSQSGTELAMLGAHSGPVTKVQFSANGRKVLSIGSDGGVRLWRLPFVFDADHDMIDYARATSLQSDLSRGDAARLFLDQIADLSNLDAGVDLPADAAEQCNLLAAHPDDPDRTAFGVTASRIQKDFAFAACKKAVSEHPLDGRLAYQLGRVYSVLGQDKQALESYQTSATAGYPKAISTLALEVLERKASPAELASALSELRRAVDLGDPRAQYELGSILLNGRLKDKDAPSALTLFRKAAESGYPWAHHQLAQVYAAGRLVKSDLAQAFHHALLAVNNFEARNRIENLEFRATRSNIAKAIGESDVVRLYRENRSP
jgi:WD40 repeat protein/TPR repeat protein